MSDPFVLVIIFIIAIIGFSLHSIAIVALSVALCFLMARDFTAKFLAALAVIYGASYIITDTQAWAAVSIAIAAVTIALTGREKKEQEEIPPEMIPYLLAMMGGGGGRR